MKIVGKETELGGCVGQDQTLAALPAGRFDQNVMTELGDIDGYQNNARLSRLGRLLITYMLTEKQMLYEPALYLSLFFQEASSFVL